MGLEGKATGQAYRDADLCWRLLHCFIFSFSDYLTRNNNELIYPVCWSFPPFPGDNAVITQSVGVPLPLFTGVVLTSFLLCRRHCTGTLSTRNSHSTCPLTEVSDEETGEQGASHQHVWATLRRGRSHLCIVTWRAGSVAPW